MPKMTVIAYEKCYFMGDYISNGLDNHLTHLTVGSQCFMMLNNLIFRCVFFFFFLLLMLHFASTQLPPFNDKVPCVSQSSGMYISHTLDC